MVGAVRRLETAVTEGFAGTALCGLADDKNKGYLHELRRYAARIRRQPGASARESVDDQLLHLAQTTNSESSIKKLLSGVRLLEKLRWVPNTICAGDWLFVKGVVQKKDPTCFVLVTCMHDTPMILWTQHEQSYHSNGTKHSGTSSNVGVRFGGWSFACAKPMVTGAIVVQMLSTRA